MLFRTRRDAVGQHPLINTAPFEVFEPGFGRARVRNGLPRASYNDGTKLCFFAYELQELSR
jgi:hypothetical protein